MATLSGHNFEDHESRISLLPVRPTREGPRDAYRVHIEVAGVVLLDRQYDVHCWQLGHFEFFRLAEAFKQAHLLFESKLVPPISLSSRDSEGALIQVGVPWFSILLLGASSQIGRYPPRVVVTLTIEPDYQYGSPQEPEFETLYGTRFYCSPDAALTFGTALEAELWECRKRRAELGIEADEDFVIPLSDEVDQGGEQGDAGD